MEDLSYKVFGRWKVLYFTRLDNCSQMWVCECECGTIKEVRKSLLTGGASKSCGCLKNEKSAKRLQTHGRSRDPAWRSAKRAIQRCYDENFPAYQSYGGRGINVYQEWIDDPVKFADYIGPRPNENYSLDRINNDGNYEPGNVKWSTREEQASNRRNTKLIEIDGNLKSQIQWCRIYGVTKDCVVRFLNKGFSGKEAFELAQARTKARIRI